MPDDALTTVRARARTNLFWSYLGIEVDDARPGWVRLRVPIRDELRKAGRRLRRCSPQVGYGTKERTSRLSTAPQAGSRRRSTPRDRS